MVNKIVIVLIFCVMFPASLFAQSLSITKSPPYPKQGEQVLITVSSFVFDLSNAVVTWKSEGETLLQGVGATNYTILAAENKSFVVEAVHQQTGEKVTQGFSVVPTEIDLLWEAVGSYTPPFYKGKALPPLEANINVVAIPNGKKPGDLFYSWEKETQGQDAQSGKGKNSFSYIATPLEQANNVSVLVSSDDNSFSSEDNLIIRYGNAEVLFYEDDPALGTLYNKAVKNDFSVEDREEITLSAIPFFITADTLTSKALDMIWSLNGIALPAQTVKNKIRLSGEQPGNVVASIFIKNSARLFEEGTVGVSLEF